MWSANVGYQCQFISWTEEDKCDLSFGDELERHHRQVLHHKVLQMTRVHLRPKSAKMCEMVKIVQRGPSLSTSVPLPGSALQGAAEDEGLVWFKSDTMCEMAKIIHMRPKSAKMWEMAKIMRRGSSPPTLAPSSGADTRVSAHDEGS